MAPQSAGKNLTDRIGPGWLRIRMPIDPGIEVRKLGRFQAKIDRGDRLLGAHTRRVGGRSGHSQCYNGA
jgi:hypothetical protein